jgi:glycosyltransferase involved in cell wall biosynthesis
MSADVCRIAIVSTHPIQYLVPVYRALAFRPDVELEVFYFTDFGQRASYDARFGKAFAWDVDLLSGYRSSLLTNRSPKPSPRFFGSFCPKMADVLNGSYDALIVPGYKCVGYLQAVAAGLRRNLPVLLRGESRDRPNQTLTKQFMRDAALRPFFRRITAFLAIGQMAHDHYTRLGVPDEKIHFSPYCVDNDRFETARTTLEGQRSDIRAAWGIPTNAIVAVIPGKLVAGKAPLDALRAASACGNEDLWLLFAGDGPQREDLVNAARTLGFSRYVVTGFVNQDAMPRAYAAADMLLLPSHSETWGVVVNEAMISGLPAFVSRAVGCAPDLVRPGLTGGTFDAGNISELAEVLCCATGSVAELQRMGARARDLVARNYSPAAAADGIVTGVRAAVHRH